MTAAAVWQHSEGDLWAAVVDAERRRRAIDAEVGDLLAELDRRGGPVTRGLVDL